MKKSLLTTLISTACLFSFGLSVSFGCWAAPPKITKGSSKGGNFTFKLYNTSGEVKVFSAKNAKKSLWSVKLNGFSGLFSKVYLMHQGSMIVHIRGNHQVNKLEDVAVEILSKDGNCTKFKAKDLVTALSSPKGQMRVSTDPGKRWLKKTAVNDDISVFLTTVEGEVKSINLKTCKISSIN